MAFVGACVGRRMRMHVRACHYTFTGRGVLHAGHERKGARADIFRSINLTSNDKGEYTYILYIVYFFYMHVR